jgi:fatty acid desaturase
METQSYHPYRFSLLTREQLRELSELRPGPVIRDTALRWAVLLAAWSAAATWTNVWVVAAAFVVVGVNLYGMLILAHDGLHGRLFANRTLNDRFNDIFFVGPVGAITRINRTNHLIHHQVTCLASDPDRHKYTHPGKDVPWGFFGFVSGLKNIWTTVRHIFLSNAPALDAAPPKSTYSTADLAILIGWQAALFVGLTFLVGWWAYPVLWLAPAYVFAYRGDLLRVFCEHSVLAPDDEADASMRIITFESNWLERQVFAPQNMNFHGAHHLWPSIPYYNLPRADAAIRAAVAARGADSRLVWRKSYVGHLLRYAVWRASSAGRQVGKGSAAAAA